MRVTYLITDLQVGGVPLHLYRLATRLSRDGVRVRVVCLAEEGPVGEMLRQAGVAVFACGARTARGFGALWGLWRLLRSEPPDILHALLFHANMAARLVGPLAGIPLGRILCEIQTVERQTEWHLVLDNLTCRLCRFEIGNSPSVVLHLHQCAHIPSARLRCEWGAVDVAAIESARMIPKEAMGLPGDEPMIIWTGRLDPVKGFEEMLGAFERACRHRPARLVLVGEGAYRARIENLIHDSRLSHRVVMLGARSDVPSLLKAADVFLFCSRTEGLPNAVLEAMAAGLPIVATDVPGTRDLIQHQRTGLLVPAGDVSGIARALGELLDDPARARQMGSRAGLWVRANLDAGQLAGRWLRVYEAVRRANPAREGAPLRCGCAPGGLQIRPGCSGRDGGVY